MKPCLFSACSVPQQETAAPSCELNLRSYTGFFLLPHPDFKSISKSCWSHPKTPPKKLPPLHPAASSVALERRRHSVAPTHGSPCFNLTHTAARPRPEGWAAGSVCRTLPSFPTALGVTPAFPDGLSALQLQDPAASHSAPWAPLHPAAGSHHTGLPLRLRLWQVPPSPPTRPRTPLPRPAGPHAPPPHLGPTPNGPPQKGLHQTGASATAPALKRHPRWIQFTSFSTRPLSETRTG